MEFPDLGKHCSEKTCKRLDFLPLKCDACKRDFCKDHFTCAAHKCPLAFTKDVRVPVCPLCNRPVPVKNGEIPDVAVGAHMDGDCRRPPRSLRSAAPERAAGGERCCKWCARSAAAASASSTDTLWITAAPAGASPAAQPGAWIPGHQGLPTRGRAAGWPGASGSK